MIDWKVYIAPQALDRPETFPARWWRDDRDRYRSRTEPAPRPLRFRLGELPAEARNHEWEKMARPLELLMMEPIVPISPLAFERLEPDPIADIMMTLKAPAPKIDPVMFLFWLDDV